MPETEEPCGTCGWWMFADRIDMQDTGNGIWCPCVCPLPAWFVMHALDAERPWTEAADGKGCFYWKPREEEKP